MLDEAMLAALSDKLKPIWTGVIYCGLLDACHELIDLRRAHEWTEAMSRWCAPLPAASLFPGICRVHRVEILDLRGRVGRRRGRGAGCVPGPARHRCVRGRRRVLRDRRAPAPARRRSRRRGGVPARPRGGTGSPAGPCAPAARAGPNGRCVGVDRRGARSPAAAAAWNGHGCSRRRSTSRSPRATSVSPMRAASEVAEIAADFESDGLRAHVASLPRRGRASPRASPSSRSVRCGWRSPTWQELDVPYEAARTRALLAEAYRLLAGRRRRRARARGGATGVRRLGRRARPPSARRRRCTAVWLDAPRGRGPSPRRMPDRATGRSRPASSSARRRRRGTSPTSTPSSASRRDRRPPTFAHEHALV